MIKSLTAPFGKQLHQQPLTLGGLRVRVGKHLVLVAEHVVVHVELVGDGSLQTNQRVNFLLEVRVGWGVGQDQVLRTHLGRQHEGLHELPHGLHVVGQLAHHLHHHALVQGGVGVYVADLGVAVAETQGHHPLMDFLQKEGGAM